MTSTTAWPVSSLTLGVGTYSPAQLLGILSQPVRGNGLVVAHQLIAARFNLASGAAVTPAVAQAIIDANALIGGLAIPRATSTVDGQRVIALHCRHYFLLFLALTLCGR